MAFYYWVWGITAVLAVFGYGYLAYRWAFARYIKSAPYAKRLEYSRKLFVDAERLCENGKNEKAFKKYAYGVFLLRQKCLPFGTWFGDRVLRSAIDWCDEEIEENTGPKKKRSKKDET